MGNIKRFKTIEEVEHLGQYESETLYNFIYNFANEIWMNTTQKSIILEFINHIYDMGRKGE